MLKNLLPLFSLFIVGINLSFSDSLEEPDVEILEEKITQHSFNKSEAIKKEEKIKEKKSKKENSPFIIPFNIVRPERMALTPNIEIPINEEHWDIFSTEGEFKTYLQWEPGTLYGAAKIAEGKDLIISLTSEKNDWLTDQSIEIRFNRTEKGLKHEIQKLNSVKGEELTWAQDKILSDLIIAKGSKENDGYHIRFKMADCIYKFVENSELSIRFDIIDSEQKQTSSYLPRLLQKVKLVTERDKNLPYGFAWHPFYRNGNKYRYVIPGETLSLKIETKRPKDALIERIKLAPRGWDANQLTFIEQPYPEFNRSDKASFTYNTLAPKKACLGYKILNIFPTYLDKSIGHMESSFKISEPIIFELNLNRDLKYNEKAQIIKGNLKMISATNYKILGGRTTLYTPMHWKILQGEVTNFSLHTREFVRYINLELVIPGATEGVYPIKFKTIAEGYEPIHYTSYILLRR